MSLNQLKIALQDYQHSYRSCVEIPPIQIDLKKQQDISISFEPNLVSEISAPLRSSPIPEPEPQQPIQNEEANAPERHHFPSENNAYQEHQPILQSGRKKISRSKPRKKKRGLNLIPVLLGGIIIILGSISYSLYDVYSSKSIATQPPFDEINLNTQKPK
jgi:hypothetical protein